MNDCWTGGQDWTSPCEGDGTREERQGKLDRKRGRGGKSSKHPFKYRRKGMMREARMTRRKVTNSNSSSSISRIKRLSCWKTWPHIFRWRLKTSSTDSSPSWLTNHHWSHRWQGKVYPHHPGGTWIQVAKFIRQRDRISLADIVESSNSLVNLTPVNPPW